MPAQQDSRRTMDFRFPLGGLNVSTGYTNQPPGTTPVAINVRGFDAGTNRARGGTRPGLNPFFGAGSTEQVNGFNPIQHLNTIVWVDPAAIG